MPLLEKLEKKGIRTYGEAVREIKSLPEEMYFYTPKNRWIVKGKI
jgi:hypothetical protein